MERKPSNIIRHLNARRGVEQLDFRQMLSPERVVDLPPGEKHELLERLIAVTATSERVTDREAFRRAIFEREKLLSTGVGNGIGLPHVKISHVSDFVMSMGRCPQGIEYGAHDGRPVNIIIMIGANESQSNAFLAVLARLMMKLKNQKFREALLEAETTETAYRLMVGDGRIP
jgi:mannitol/fructose-specific phosphotransferase system IIA component (Ntr-type)